MSATPSLKFPSFMNISEVAKKAKIKYARLYFRDTGKTKEELPLVARTRVVNAIFPELEIFFDNMGFELRMKPKKISRTVSHPEQG